MKRLTTLALLVGLCTAVGLFLSSGLEDVVAALLGAGFVGVFAVVGLRIVAVAWAGLGWFVVFPSRERPRLADCVRLRYVREGINTLLPVAAVGGDFIGARLLARRGTAGGLAGASMFVDLMTQALTQLLFTVCGLAVLMALEGDGPIVRAVTGGLVVAVPALAAFYLIQRRSGHRLIQAALSRFASGREWRALGAVDTLYASLRRLYGNGARVLNAVVLHGIGWIIGTVEVWICLHAMGYPVSFAEAIVIESLAQAVRGAAFAIPGALGAQEGGLIALCALFDIPAEAALALSLIKRLADLAVGVPSLFLWHALEGGTPGGEPSNKPDHSLQGLRERLGRTFGRDADAAAGTPAGEREPGRTTSSRHLAGSPVLDCGDLKKCA